MKRGVPAAEPGVVLVDREKLKADSLETIAPKPKLKRKPGKTQRKIHEDQRTYEAGIMAMMGMYSRVIESRTGLSKGQCAYRLKQSGANVERKLYREGRSELAELILKKARPVAEQQFTDMLREKLNL